MKKEGASRRREAFFAAMSQTSNLGVLNGGLRHVVLFGKTGSGKSSIFHQLVEKDKKLELGYTQAGSKYSPVVGLCKLGQAGNITVIDTAGLDDVDELGNEQARRTRNVIRRADIAIYVIDIQEFDRAAYKRAHDWLERNMIPYLQVFNHCDETYVGDIARLKMEFPDAIFISTRTPGSISLLRARLSQLVRKIKVKEAPMIPEGLVEPGDYVLLLSPHANKEIMLNQHKIVNELVNRSVRCVVIDESDLDATLKEIPRIDLVIVYARSFGIARDIIPESIPLTSYSLLNALQCGVLEDFFDGAAAISKLNKDSRVLITEDIENNGTFHDIGRIKIPRALRKLAGEELHIDYISGIDLPDDIDAYDLVIHDAGLTMTPRSVQARVSICREAGVPIANYGTVLAALCGMTSRCKKVLLPETK